MLLPFDSESFLDQLSSIKKKFRILIISFVGGTVEKIVGTSNWRSVGGKGPELGIQYVLLFFCCSIFSYIFKALLIFCGNAVTMPSNPNPSCNTLNSEFDKNLQNHPWILSWKYSGENLRLNTNPAASSPLPLSIECISYSVTNSVLNKIVNSYNCKEFLISIFFLSWCGLNMQQHSLLHSKPAAENQKIALSSFGRGRYQH